MFSWRPLAVAASLVVAVGLGRYAWRWYLSDASAARGIAANPLDAQLTDRVVHVHCDCLATEINGHQHQGADLPRGLAAVQEKASAHYGGALAAMAPDFSRAGFVLASSNWCGIAPKQRGLHVLYTHRKSGAHLSFFNIPSASIDLAGTTSATSGSAAKYFTDNQTRDGVPYGVVGWQSPGGHTSYLACAVMPAAELLKLVDSAAASASVATVKPARPAVTAPGDAGYEKLFRRKPQDP
jgi:hypothetical protein